MTWPVMLLYSTMLLLSPFTMGALYAGYLNSPTKKVDKSPLNHGIRKRGIFLNLLGFILSLQLIGLSFFLQELWSGESNAIQQALIMLLAVGGGGLNLWILRPLASEITSTVFPASLKKGYNLWCTVYIVAGIGVFLFPNTPFFAVTTMIMLPVSIMSYLIFLMIKLNSTRGTVYYQPLRSFLLLSTAFLVALLLDMGISLLPLPALSVLDGFSVPLYLLALNTGILGTIIYNRKSGERISSQSKNAVDKENAASYENPFSIPSEWGLSDRERDICRLIGEGFSNKDIAETLFISIKTVETHLSSVYRKANVSSRAKLIVLLRE